MSQEYLSAIVILIVSVLKIFGIELANDVVSGIVVGLAALWIAIRRKQRGVITAFGVRK